MYFTNGDSVGRWDGLRVGLEYDVVGFNEQGLKLGSLLLSNDGSSVGKIVGLELGSCVGACVNIRVVGSELGSMLGVCVGAALGDVGTALGSDVG